MENLKKLFVLMLITAVFTLGTIACGDTSEPPSDELPTEEAMPEEIPTEEAMPEEIPAEELPSEENLE